VHKPVLQISVIVDTIRGQRRNQDLRNGEEKPARGESRCYIRAWRHIMLGRGMKEVIVPSPSDYGILKSVV